MLYCKNCGGQIPDDAKFCTFCGTNQSESTSGTTNVNTTTAETVDLDFSTPETAAPSGKLNVGYLIWSIINLLCCCTPLGIAGLIFVIMAKDAVSLEEENKKIKTSKICNLIGTIVGVVTVVLYVVLIVILALAGADV